MKRRHTMLPAMKLTESQFIFMCVMCGEVFDKVWTDEESMAEARATFTAEELEDPILVCNPCWLLMRVMDPELDRRYEESFNATT